MGATIFHVGAQAICPHAGQVSTISSNVRVKVGGLAAATASDTFQVAACSFMMGNTPSPCLTVEWLQPALRVKVSGKPVVLMSSTGLCKAGTQAPQGPPSVINTQVRASGT
jgi:hypothetical protein